ncbi:MAG TPA: opacity protein [Bacteroidetes bacterium]|nr:opacity protein [Bacteroidota bacterium]
MKTITTLFTTLLTVILTVSVAQSQDTTNRFSFELNSGISLPTTDIGDAELGTGVGFEGIFHYRILQHTGVYLGWGWKHFPSESSFAGEDIEFEETGYIYGVQFKHPFGKSGLSYILRAGGNWSHLELENSDGDITYDTKHGAGWQVSGGVDIPLGRKWSLTPTIKYSSLNRDYKTETGNFSADLNYVAINIGFFKKF